MLSTIGTCLFVVSSIAVLPESLRFFADTPFLGGTDVNLITGGEIFPKVTQSESAVWGQGNTIVVVYNDSRGSSLSPVNYSGISVSTDGGATFTRLSPSPFTGSGANFGEPSIFYSVRAGKWYAGFIARGCGGNGLGQWESADGLSWTASGCMASGNLDGVFTWVDNNPNSAFYGRQYAAFNNFDIATTPPQLRYSTDDGVTWSAAITLSSSFRRVRSVTGSRGADGTVFVQGLEEGSGGLDGLRRNFIYRSTNGGASFSEIAQNATTFLSPGRSSSSGFYGMYSSPVAGYWRENGWGQAGVGPGGVVHFATLVAPRLPQILATSITSVPPITALPGLLRCS
ncbi:MAG: sialidase family protein [Vicinamibacterales bacterium]